LGPGERQLGRSVDKVELRAGATAMPVTVESPASERTVKWEVGRDVKSPVSGRSVGILKIAWVCLSVDTWTGRITDCREVLIGEKGTSVSRTRNTEIVVDLSADLPVNVLGLGGLALGIGRAEENIFGGGDVSQMSLVA
jgi:hypothetical protein